MRPIFTGDRPRSAKDHAFLFVGAMGGMKRRGRENQAETVAGLLHGLATATAPGVEAREIAEAVTAWAALFSENPEQAVRLATRIMDGPSGAMQSRFDLPPAQQPQRRAAAPRPRGP